MTKSIAAAAAAAVAAAVAVVVAAIVASVGGFGVGAPPDTRGAWPCIDGHGPRRPLCLS